MIGCAQCHSDLMGRPFFSLYKGQPIVCALYSTTKSGEDQKKDV